MDVGRYAKIGQLYGDEAEEVGGYRGRIRLCSARGEGEGEGRVPFGSHVD